MSVAVLIVAFLHMCSAHSRHRLAVPAAAPGVPGGLPPAEGAGLCEEGHEDPERPQSYFSVR